MAGHDTLTSLSIDRNPLASHFETRVVSLANPASRERARAWNNALSFRLREFCLLHASSTQRSAAWRSCQVGHHSARHQESQKPGSGLSRTCLCLAHSHPGLYAASFL